MASDIKLVQLNSYVRPKLEENKSKNWVMNGRNNIFYQYIIDRFNGSPTNSAIINSYIDLVFGKGLTSDDKNAVELLNKVTTETEIKRIVSDFVLFGETTMQIVAKKEEENMPSILHLATNKTIPQLENEKGEIEGYWFSKDWSKINKAENKPNDFPVFGKKAPITIYRVKPYKAGKEYFCDPLYMAGLPYAEMEEEIANYCINHIQNGLSFGYIINVPDGANWNPEQRQAFERQLKTKLTGSQNAGKFIIAFNGRDMEVNVVPLDVNSAHKQWEFLTQESRQQLLTAHRVTSPMLFGIKDNTGLGNNAQELDTAELQLYKRVIVPMQRHITSAIETIFREYGYNFEFYFLPLTENTADSSKSFDSGQVSSALQIMTNVNNGLLTEEQGKSLLASMLSYPQEQLDNIFKERPQKKLVDDAGKNEENAQLHSHDGCSCIHLNDTPIQNIIDSIADDFVLSGEKEEDFLNDFDLVSEDDESFDLKENQLNDIVQLARAPFSTPKKKSEQDTSLFKIRYQYKGAKTGQREFCKKVLKENRVYRWEDLERASQKVVNAGFGLKGADTYDIAKYKGGVNCKHFWQRKIYLRKNNKSISVNTARKMILELPTSERDDARWDKNPKEVAQVASPSNNFWRAN